MDYENPVIFSYREPGAPPHIAALTVIFREHAEKNETFSAASGVDSFDNVLVAYVAPIGMPKSSASCEIERRLPDGTIKQHPVHARKYAEQVKMYKAGNGEGAAGTPLSQLPQMDPGTIAGLKARGIHTVEMLSELSDNGGAELMGFRGLKERAQKFVALREKNAPVVQMQAELESRDKLIHSLQRQLDELTAKVAEADLDQPPRRGPGRPRKDEAA